MENERVNMPCPPPVLKLRARLLPTPLPHRDWEIGGAIFLDDYISKEWLPGPQEKKVLGNTIEKLKSDLHLKGAENEFTVTRFLN